jgi:uncharacterized protein
MYQRLAFSEIEAALARQAAVAIIGPRQVGKTTLALDLAATRPSVYLDLQSSADRAKLAEPELYLRAQSDRLVILDEIHRAPGLFPVLRGLIDQARRRGQRSGLYLLLGSASIELLKQSGESLAGRIAFIELPPIHPLEVNVDGASIDQLWLRGGFPDSLRAASDADSLTVRRDFIRTYLERDVAEFGPRLPSETLLRLWTMLAHQHGQLLNASRLAAALEVSSPTVARYLDLLVSLLLIRRLNPLHANVGKRLVKSPKVYVRDGGIAHALLGLGTHDELLGHPVVGASWEGFVVESILSAAPASALPSFYRTAAGAEVDLVLDFAGRSGRWAIEIKRTAAPKVSRGMREAITDLKPERSLVVYAGDERYPLARDVEAIGLMELLRELRGLRGA